MKIGIFSGTFDPFTEGHFEIVKKVLADKIVDKVIILPTIVNYYRKDKESLFSFYERELIIQKWFANIDNVILDFTEYIQDKSINNERRYINMLEDLIKRYSNTESIEYYTIIGYDSYLNFTTWYNWSEILKLSKLITVNRGPQIFTGSSRDYLEMVPSKFINIDNKFSNISATKIRERLSSCIKNMSLGPSATPLSIYLEQINNYLKSGKTFEEMDKEFNEQQNQIKIKLEEQALKEIENKLQKINDILNDPYKDAFCKYSLITDLIEGTL